MGRGALEEADWAVIQRGEAISTEEARAYVLLRELGWSKIKIARVFRREQKNVSYHLAAQEFEMRAARQLRMTQAVRI